MLNHFLKGHTASGKYPTFESKQTTSRIQICHPCQFTSWMKNLQYLWDGFHSYWQNKNVPFIFWPLQRFFRYLSFQSPKSFLYWNICQSANTHCFIKSLCVWFFFAWKAVHSNPCTHLSGKSTGILQECSTITVVGFFFLFDFFFLRPLRHFFLEIFIPGCQSMCRNASSTRQISRTTNFHGHMQKRKY